MGQIISGIVIAVISGWILSLFGIGNSKTVIHTQGHQSMSKSWKIFRILGWLMFIGGGYYFLAWLSVGGFTIPQTGFGLTISVLGFLLLLATKFSAFWNR